MGHEIAGIIEAFGDEAKPKDVGLNIGDLVVVFPWVGCGECNECKSGNSNICDRNIGGSCDFGQGPAHPGGYSTHVLAHQLEILVKVPENVPSEFACLMACSGGTSYAALKKAKPYIEEGLKMNNHANILVVGAGGLGLWSVQLSKLMFPGKKVNVTVADINDKKLINSLQFGADSIIKWQKGYASFDEFFEDVRKTNEDGQRQFDAAIELVGTKNSFSLACQSLRKGGTIVSVGLFGGVVEMPIVEIISRQITIQGNRVFGLPLFREFVDFLREKKVFYPSLEFYQLDQINTVIKKLQKGDIKGRALIMF